MIRFSLPVFGTVQSFERRQRCIGGERATGALHYEPTGCWLSVKLFDESVISFYVGDEMLVPDELPRKGQLVGLSLTITGAKAL